MKSLLKSIKYIKIIKIMGIYSIAKNDASGNSVNRLILEDCKTGRVLGEKNVGDNYIQEGCECLQNIIDDIDSYRFVIIHFSDEDYHTRILARKRLFVDGIECEEITFRATFYKIKKNKNRICGISSLFRFFTDTYVKSGEETVNDMLLPIVTNKNVSNVISYKGKS